MTNFFEQPAPPQGSAPDQGRQNVGGQTGTATLDQTNPYEGISLSKIAEKIKVISLSYYEVGRFVPVFMRPYTAQVDKAAINTLADRLGASSKGDQITSSEVSGISKGLIYPSAVPVPTSIDASWTSNKRFIFILKIGTTNRMNHTNYMYLIGYTNHADISYAGTLDPEMIHHANSVIETIEIPAQTAFGTVVKEKLVTCYNLIENSMPDMNSFLQLQRPIDINNHLYNEEMRNAMIHGGITEGVTIHNQSSMLRGGAKNIHTSNSLNCIPSNYIANTVNGSILGLRQNELDTSNLNPTYVVGIDNTFTAEPDITNSAFLSIVRRYSYGSSFNAFALKLLTSMDSTVESRAQVLRMNQSVDVSPAGSTPESGEHWHGQDRDTLTAYSFIESAMALAARYGISKLDMVASNMTTHVLEPSCTIYYFNSFIDMDDRSLLSLLEMFKQNFINSVFNDETGNNAHPLHVRICIDLAGSCKICLYDTTGRETWYTLPGFASSAFTPVTTLNTDTFEHLAHSVGEVAREVSLSQRQNVFTQGY